MEQEHQQQVVTHLISSALILSSFFVSFSFIFKVQLHLNLSIVSPHNGRGKLAVKVGEMSPLIQTVSSDMTNKS